MRVIIPPLTNQYLNLTKNSTLAAAIGYPDLVAVFAGTTLNQTHQAIEIIAITMAVYLVISLATSLAMNAYNARIRLTRAAEATMSAAFVRQQLIAPLEPPRSIVGTPAWLRPKIVRQRPQHHRDAGSAP